jgi:hypothetical protein
MRDDGAARVQAGPLGLEITERPPARRLTLPDVQAAEAKARLAELRAEWGSPHMNAPSLRALISNNVHSLSSGFKFERSCFEFT